MLNVLSAYALSDPEIGYTQVGGAVGACRWCLLIGNGHPPRRLQPAWSGLSVFARHSPPPLSPQGMNFITGLLLTYLPGEAEAYAALSLVMRQRGLREM